MIKLFVVIYNATIKNRHYKQSTFEYEIVSNSYIAVTELVW